MNFEMLGLFTLTYYFKNNSQKLNKVLIWLHVDARTFLLQESLAFSPRDLRDLSSALLPQHLNSRELTYPDSVHHGHF